MGHGARSLWGKLRREVELGSFKRLKTKAAAAGNNDEIIISEPYYDEEKEISEIVITINDYVQRASNIQKSVLSKSSSSSICRVPNNLREIHTNAFDPKIVSIGPFHRNKPHLKAMEDHKMRLLSSLLLDSSVLMMIQQQQGNSISSTTDQNSSSSNNPISSTSPGSDPNNIKIQRLLAGAIKMLEEDARGCYLETFDSVGSKEFVSMMILDGCFVVELLRLYAKCEKENVDDPIFITRWMLPILQRDLLLLENQLPFLVLEKIFEITNNSASTEPAAAYNNLRELAVKFFDPLMPSTGKKILETISELDVKPDHLLGLFRSSFLSAFKDRKSSSVRPHYQLVDPQNKQAMTAAASVYTPPQVVQQAQDGQQLIHCAMELKQAGIKFKKRENHNLLDIEFKKGVLHIPPLLIDDHTGPVFLNFLASEQCDPYSEPYFTHYVLFLDSLVNSSKDVELLHYNGIIDHVLGCDEDVANLLNKLCKEIVHDVDNCYISKELKNINQYYDTKWHTWRAKWKHDYFSSPWAFFSFLAAILLLLLTAIQTFFAVFSYARPPIS